MSSGAEAAGRAEVLQTHLGCCQLCWGQGWGRSVAQLWDQLPGPQASLHGYSDWAGTH